ncbi:MAG: hypothetical protein NTZ24_07955 [Deltaproteobacteria bacterium]|nr:hypothetical protein [Deltaproteobacteria bacterium]
MTVSSLAATLAKPLHFRKQPLEILILVHVILAVGLNILVGYTGQLSIGYAGFLPLAPRRPHYNCRNIRLDRIY